jgi:serine phosphatase RsbU (regulator of sigma subunit)
MSRKLAGYPDEIRAVLGIAACIGNTFEMETLEAASEKNISELLPLLASPLEDNVIILKETAAFTHDRLQEAAYRLLDETNLADIHYKTGKFLYRRYYDSDDNGKYLFRIADHLNAAVEIITDPDEKQTLTEINLQAGKKAMKSVAYKSALTYLKAGIDLMPADCFKMMYDIAFELHLEFAEATHMNGETEKAIAGLDELLNKSRKGADVTKVYIKKISYLSFLGKYNESLKIGRSYLKIQGINIKKSYIQFIYLFLRTRNFFRTSSVESIQNLPLVEDKDELLLQDLIYSLGFSIYGYSALLFANLCMSFFKNPKLHNYTSGFFLTYGSILIKLKKYNEANRIGNLSVSLIREMNIIVSKAAVLVALNNIIFPWNIHLKKCLTYTEEAYLDYFETSDVSWSTWASFENLFYKFLIGISISELQNEIKKYYNFIAQKDDLNFHIKLLLQCTIYFKGSTYSYANWDDDYFSEKNIINEIKTVHAVKFAQYIYYFLKEFTLIFSGKYSEALILCKSSDWFFTKTTISNLIVHPLHIFMYTISITKQYPIASKKISRAHLRLCGKHIKQMRLWAKNCPDNFLQFYLLMQAEISRITGKRQKDENGRHLSVEELYDRAIATSGKYEYVNFEAIANDIAGEYYFEKKSNRAGSGYILEAYRLFEKWGASAKCSQLKEKYPELFAAVPVVGNVFNSVDMMSIMKVSQSLTGDIELGSLIKKISRYVIENAGADKGVLILIDPAGGRLEVKAVIKAGSDADILDGVYIDNRADLPESLIRYVERTKEIYISGAAGVPAFSEDRYLASKKPQSILCAPIINQGRLTGIMYLENSLARDAFTAGRVEILNMLISQAAVSIENARLYADMEERVLERTAVIEKQKEAYELDIQLARRIQLSLLPDQLPRAGSSLLAFKYVPMMGVGGDFLDIIYQSEGRRLLGLFMCDVSGHGVPAALTASMVKMSLGAWRGLIERPADTLSSISSSLAGKLGGNFITACVCLIDLDSGELTFARAGHPPLLVVRADGVSEFFSPRGRLINDLMKPNYDEVRIQLFDGDKIIIYTDGITEARAGGDGLMLGEEGFAEFACANRSMPPEDLCVSAFERVASFSGSAQLEDDFTILAFEYRR